MKKTVILGLLVIILVFCFSSCDNETTDNVGKTDSIKQSDFYGMWEYEDNTGDEHDQFVEISATFIRFSMSNGMFVKMSITNWVEITDSGYISYPKGYTINGVLSESSNDWIIEFPMDIYLHIDKQSIYTNGIWNKSTI